MTEMENKVNLSAYKSKKAFLKIAHNHILQKGSILGEFE